MPLISVLIPCYNSEKWLGWAVGSILEQTCSDFEVLLYDDGSTDDSKLIIERLAASDKRIAVFEGASNKGIVHALNTMIDASRGVYIARMDADDISLPRRLEEQVNYIKSGHADLCGTWFQEFGKSIPRSVRWKNSPQELQAAMLFQNTICHPTVMAKREVFETFQYRENYNLAEDYDFFVRAATQYRLANLPSVLLRYRRHPQQATQARRMQMEEVTRRIRIEALAMQGIEASQEEQRIHNLIRAPQSIRSMDELDHIEAWLLKLCQIFEHPDAKRVICAQWTRAAIRSAPLGWPMLRKYRQSALYHILSPRWGENIDLAVLATMRLDYQSPAFDTLRRLGLGA